MHHTFRKIEIEKLNFLPFQINHSWSFLFNLWVFYSVLLVVGEESFRWTGNSVIQRSSLCGQRGLRSMFVHTKAS